MKEIKKPKNFLHDDELFLEDEDESFSSLQPSHRKKENSQIPDLLEQ